MNFSLKVDSTNIILKPFLFFFCYCVLSFYVIQGSIELNAQLLRIFMAMLKSMELDQFTPAKVCYLFLKVNYSECTLEK